MPRREFSTRTKRAAWIRAQGCCEGWLSVDCGHAPPIFTRCNTPLAGIGCHYDHIDPEWFSHENDLKNCQVLCRKCHSAKTVNDVKHIAKSKRLIDKGMGIKKKSKFRGWRKFDGTAVYNR